MSIQFPHDRSPIHKPEELVQTIHTMNDGQRLALAEELLHLVSESSHTNPGKLQEREVLPFDPALEEPDEAVPEGEEPTGTPVRNPAYLRMLLLLLQQLQSLLGTTFDLNMSLELEKQIGKGAQHKLPKDKEKPPIQESGAKVLEKGVTGAEKNLPKSLLDAQQTVIKTANQNMRPEQAPLAKNLQANLTLKLLQINRLVQGLVPHSNAPKERKETNSLEPKLLSELGKFFGKIEALKRMVEEQKFLIPMKFIQMVTQRLNEIAMKLNSLGGTTLGNIAKPAQEMLLQRLAQEVEWVSSFDEVIEQQLLSPKKESTQEMATLKEFLKTTLPQQVNTQKAVINELKDIQSIAGAQKTVQIPRSAHEMANMIQTHLVRGIPQLLPLIVPYPIPLTFNDSLNEAYAAEKDRGSDAKKGEKRLGTANGSSQMMVLIPPGPVIVGDPFEEGRHDEHPTRIEQLEPFLIATTPVTNVQFAAWLSEALLRKTIIIEHPGKVYDDKGRLLCMTNEGAPFSQIEVAVQDGTLSFRPLPTKDHHPVVHVTYEGAIAFCKANGVRLPTEEEWERAASMMPTAYGAPLQKIRYGCPSDPLNSSSAVYRETGAASSRENRTTPVSFFDGEKIYTKDGERVKTAFSSSPWDCFDMSGNVREWTASDFDEDGLFIITKGGSYNDTVFDLRVAAKIPLPPALSDPFTGFRVVL